MHWGEAPREAIQALRQEGVKVQVAYFRSNQDGLAASSLYLPLEQWRYMSGHDYWKDRQMDVTFICHDIVINLFRCRKSCHTWSVLPRIRTSPR